eukprot:7094991-Prymnesium_polylepis.1
MAHAGWPPRRVWHISLGRENVTVSPVHRRPVTSWRCIRSGPPHVRLAWAWERSRTRVVGRGVADVRSGPARRACRLSFTPGSERACTHMHTHARTCTRMHTHAHACTRMHTLPHTPSHSLTYDKVSISSVP